MGIKSVIYADTKNVNLPKWQIVPKKGIGEKHYILGTCTGSFFQKPIFGKNFLRVHFVNKVSFMFEIEVK
jgi:hypothetical protein